MSLILTRSPYFVSRGSYSETAALKLEIGEKFLSGFTISKTYSLLFRNALSIDISPFIRDYISVANNIGQDIVYVRTTLSGVDFNGDDLADTVEENFASDGYLFSTDEYNEDITNNLQEKCWLSVNSDTIYRLDDAPLILQFFQPKPKLISGESYESVNVSFSKLGKEVSNSLVTFFNGESRASNQILNTFGLFGDGGTYKSRIENDNGVLEESKCLKNFFGEVKLESFDKITLTTESGYSRVVNVKTIEECKYKPYKVIFINRYGNKETIWFFKRSDISMGVQKESYRGNSLERYTSLYPIKTKIDFNINGQEKITLNSGFVDEGMNEVFRQLLLSQEVTLYDYTENKTYNVNLGTSEFQYKQHVNDKLINYTIEFEFAHEVINNVG